MTIINNIYLLFFSKLHILLFLVIFSKVIIKYITSFDITSFMQICHLLNDKISKWYLIKIQIFQGSFVLVTGQWAMIVAFENLTSNYAEVFDYLSKRLSMVGS